MADCSPRAELDELRRLYAQAREDLRRIATHVYPDHFTATAARLALHHLDREEMIGGISGDWRRAPEARP